MDDLVKKNGFTMMEVMVALAIVGISLGIFISVLGNSMKTRLKLDEHAKSVANARVIAEKMRLGLLENFTGTEEEGEPTESETEEGLKWQATKVPIKSRMNKDDESSSLFKDTLNEEDLILTGDTSNGGIVFFNINVEGVELLSSFVIKPQR